MRFSLLPWVCAREVTDLTPAFLEKNGIDLLMLDFDNTLVPYTADAPTEKVSRWLQEMKDSPVKLCMVSNSKKGKVRAFCQKWQIACITHSGKPFGNGISRCLTQFGITPDRCALAGDQIYTDTLGANLNGVRPILVRSINNHNFWLKLRHVAEMPFILMAKKRRIQNDES